MIRRVRIVEGVHGKVEHPVRRIAVLKDHLIDSPEVELAPEGARGYEIVRIKKAEVNGNQVNGYKGANHKGGSATAGTASLALGFKALGGALWRGAAPKKAEERKSDEDCASKGVHPQKVASVLTQGKREGVGIGRIRI